jgi:phage tail-like protein
VRSGATVATFQTCRGLGSSSEVIEFRDGGDPNIVRKLPGRLDLSDVICTRSLSSDVALSAWRALVEQGNIDQARSDVEIVGYDTSLQPVARYKLTNAWPAEVQVVGGLTSTVELLRLVHEGIQRIAP